MKCFHFPTVAASSDKGIAGGEGPAAGSWSARVPWARSFSVASSSSEARRSGFESGGWEQDISRAAAAVGWPRRRPEELRVFGFAELKAATRGFSRELLIGEGGFGCVYRGVICVSREEEEAGLKTMDVAVKQHNKYGWQGHKEWITEVNYLGVVKHPNLVKLVGYCAEDDERGIQRLLVYELMPNKSLEDHLLSRMPSNISWVLRLKIAYHAACGLAYLHEGMDFQLIFRDFKSSNILLDEDFNAKLSDFGLAQHGPFEGADHVSTSFVGTIGYAAPEYVQMGRLTAKIDVWSFGVVLYELITGRRSIERNLPRNEQKLLDWVKPYATDPKKLHIIIDPWLEGNYSVKSVQKLICLANRCLMKKPNARPRMSEVVEMLKEIMEMPIEDSAVSRAPSDAGDYDFEGKNTLKDIICDWIREFDFKELISLGNRTMGKLDWKVLAPGPVIKLTRTWL